MMSSWQRHERLINNPGFNCAILKTQNVTESWRLLVFRSNNDNPATLTTRNVYKSLYKFGLGDTNVWMLDSWFVKWIFLRGYEGV